MGTHERHWMHRSVIASPRIEGSLISRFHRSFARSRVCLLVYTRTIVPKFASPVVEIKITSQQQRPALRQGISSMLANVKQRLSAGVCVGAFRKQIQSLAGASYSVILVGAQQVRHCRRTLPRYNHRVRIQPAWLRRPYSQRDVDY